jgi:hypothetical protein
MDGTQHWPGMCFKFDFLQPYFTSEITFELSSIISHNFSPRLDGIIPPSSIDSFEKIHRSLKAHSRRPLPIDSFEIGSGVLRHIQDSFH